MGYNFLTGASRRYVIDYLIKPRDGWTCLRHCLVGNVLWTVVQHVNAEGQTNLYLNCILLARSGGDWGYKDMGESSHPYYYSCPLAYLDLVPVANEEWRAKVKAYHEAKKSALDIKTLNIGDVLIFAKTLSVPQVRVVEKEGTSLIGEYGGQHYKVRRSVLSKVVEVVKAAVALDASCAQSHAQEAAHG